LITETDQLDALNPLLVSEEALLQAEADTFWSLCRIFEDIQENYIFAQPGIQRMVFQLEELVRRVDLKLFDHLRSEGVGFMSLCYRWMNCFLLRELPFELVLRLFDTYFSEGDWVGFHVYLCGALLVSFSPQLLSLDFGGVLQFAQALPLQDLGEQGLASLLAQAYVYQSLFSCAK
jgi:hypothetical protein